MVCVPCIILPVLLAIYLKFIQPLILRFVPDSWKTRVDAVLYPTCPVLLQKPASSTELDNNSTNSVEQPQKLDKCVETKKDL